MVNKTLGIHLLVTILSTNNLHTVKQFQIYQWHDNLKSF